MEKDIDLNKTVRQHLEMERFFTGFMLKGRSESYEKQDQEDIMPVAEKTAELEKIAGQVNQCRKCELGSLRTNTVPGEGNPNARIMFVGRHPAPTKMHKVDRSSAGPASYWIR